MSVDIHNPDVVACIKRAYTHRDNYELRSEFRMELRPHAGPYLFGDPEDVVGVSSGRVVAIVADKGVGVCVYTPEGKFIG